MIVKIQRPLVSTDDPPPALVYNRDRSYRAFVPFDQELQKLMGEAVKIFAEVTESCDGLEIIRVLPAQPW